MRQSRNQTNPAESNGPGNPIDPPANEERQTVGILSDWIRDKVVSVSRCEIIEKYRTYNGRANVARMTRVRLSTRPNNSGLPTQCLVSIQQDDGKWKERCSKLSWKMPPAQYDRREKYKVYVAITRLTYKGWTSSPVEMFGFLRVGIRGAVFLMPNGDRMEIESPPFNWSVKEPEPPTHLRNLTVVGGFLTDSMVPHPERPAFEQWARDISEVNAHLTQRADLAGDRIDPGTHTKNFRAICSICGKHAAQDPNPDAAWRMFQNKFYCQPCNEGRGK